MPSSIDVCLGVGVLNDAGSRASSNQHPAGRVGLLLPVCCALTALPPSPYGPDIVRCGMTVRNIDAACNE
jgi:hypothetical protein